MPGIIFPGSLVAVDYFRKLRSAIKCPAKTELFFLTHMHSDHTRGLSNRWTSGVIYCSKITKSLLHMKYGLNDCQVIALDLKVDHQIHVPSTGETLHVRLLDAYHCPGSVMFVFRGCNFTGLGILYCGDFRTECSMLQEMNMMDAIGGPVDHVYLDDTYLKLGLKFTIPERAKVISDVIAALATQHCLWSSVTFPVYELGKEHAIVEIARHFKVKIGVHSEDRLRTFQAIGLESESVHPVGDCWMSTCPWIPPRRVDSDSSNLVIRLSGRMLWMPSRDERKNSDGRNLSFPYTDHCSPYELCAFLSQIRFESLHSSLGYGQRKANLRLLMEMQETYGGNSQQLVSDVSSRCSTDIGHIGEEGREQAEAAAAGGVLHIKSGESLYMSCDDSAHDDDDENDFEMKREAGEKRVHPRDLVDPLPKLKHARQLFYEASSSGDDDDMLNTLDDCCADEEDVSMTVERSNPAVGAKQSKDDHTKTRCNIEHSGEVLCSLSTSHGPTRSIRHHIEATHTDSLERSISKLKLTVPSGGGPITSDCPPSDGVCTENMIDETATMQTIDSNRRNQSNNDDDDDDDGKMMVTTAIADVEMDPLSRMDTVVLHTNDDIPSFDSDLDLHVMRNALGEEDSMRTECNEEENCVTVNASSITKMTAVQSINGYSPSEVTCLDRKKADIPSYVRSQRYASETTQQPRLATPHQTVNECHISSGTGAKTTIDNVDKQINTVQHRESISNDPIFQRMIVANMLCPNTIESASQKPVPAATHKRLTHEQLNGKHQPVRPASASTTPNHDDHYDCGNDLIHGECSADRGSNHVCSLDQEDRSCRVCLGMTSSNMSPSKLSSCSTLTPHRYSSVTIIRRTLPGRYEEEEEEEEEDVLTMLSRHCQSQVDAGSRVLAKKLHQRLKAMTWIRR